MNMRLILFFIIVFNFSYAQDDDEYFYPPFELKDKIYKSEIKSMHVSQKDWNMAPPYFELGTLEALRLGFDLLGNDVKDYSYTYIHCTPDWEESDIQDYEYIDGFLEDNIYNYDFSFNTIQKYVHYDVVFPTENMNITKSGNYILKVYESGDPENIVLTARFHVWVPLADIQANVQWATILEDRYTHQEVDFNFTYKALEVTDPFNEFKVVLLQNERWDNAITNLNPVFVRDKQLIYDYDRENVFPAGNEYRHFDTRNLNYFSDRIDSIYFQNDTNKVQLFSDTKRTFLKYSTDRDMNGKRILGLENNQAFNTDADYAEVKFNLPFDHVLDNGSIYVFGQLTNWDYLPEAKMTYNYKLHRYETSMFLKQGYYNYEYIYVEGDAKVGDNTYIEGSHYQTENSYKILIYHRAFSDRHFKLIGVKTVGSL